MTPGCTSTARLLVEHTGALSSVSAPVQLVAGRTHDIRVEYSAPALNSYQGGQVRLFWTHPDSMTTPKMARAVRVADRARVAVVVVRDYETEGVDRPDLRLPKEQDLLIRKVAAVNPRTIVVVETGATSVLRAWQRRVEGIVQAWYPGQEQGRAIADVLWGDVNPSGRLPATVPRSESQVPGTPAGVAAYTEGVNVGYRGFLATGTRPAYPFGFGRSYTRFRYDGLRVRATANGRGAIARFRVTNVGDRTGTAVPQVYVGRLPTRVATPPRQARRLRHRAAPPGTQPRRAGADRPGVGVLLEHRQRRVGHPARPGAGPRRERRAGHAGPDGADRLTRPPDGRSPLLGERAQTSLPSRTVGVPRRKVATTRPGSSMPRYGVLRLRLAESVGSMVRRAAGS